MILSVVGTGNMGQALVRGLLSKQAVDGANLRLFDADTKKAQTLADAVGACACTKLSQAIEGADVLILAVKPLVVPDVLRDAGRLRQNQLLVSIAAGVTLAQLRWLAGPEAAIARVMPNTPALIGAGVSAVCFDGADEQQQQTTRLLLSACGRVYGVAEASMDAVTGLSGSGPAYIMLVIEALADGAVRQGLPREMALEMAAMTVYGSAALVLETGTHPAVLKDQVCSPGGTTIEAIATLEAGGLRAALINAVAASTGKARQLRQPDEPHA